MNCCGSKNFNIIKGDCRDEKLIQDNIKNFDIVIPLAAIVGAPMCENDKIAASTVNYDAIKMICDNLSNEQRILMPITNSGYGIGEKGKFCTEETPMKPISLYGRTKVHAEEEVLNRNNSISFRLATVFGASQRMRIDLLVNDFVYRAVNDKSILLFEGHFKRNFIHIKDVARVFEHAIINFEIMKSKCFNVGLENANLSKIELCEKIQKYIPNFVYKEAEIGEDPDKRDYIVSNKRLLNTGFTTKYDLDMGITELMKAYTIIKNNLYSNV